jgi:(R,R)-butanediol dehydrogenase/meso-butanediol dehydrogenase/diacetyl reductase
VDPMDLAHRDVTLTGTWCYPVQDWPRVIALIAAGLPVERVVSDVIDAGDVVRLGFDRLVRPGTDVQKILVRA